MYGISKQKMILKKQIKMYHNMKGHQVYIHLGIGLGKNHMEKEISHRYFCIVHIFFLYFNYATLLHITKLFISDLTFRKSVIVAWKLSFQKAGMLTINK